MNTVLLFWKLYLPEKYLFWNKASKVAGSNIKGNIQ
jgi:hypothetical protein